MLFIWVALYGLVNIFANILSDAGLGIWWSRGILLASYDVLLLFWISRTGRRNDAGLAPALPAAKAPVFLLILAVFPLYNLLTSDVQYLGIGFLLQMLCTVLAEELFFRGFLMSALRKQGLLRSIILTSLAFAVFHGVNFLEYADQTYIWAQIISAFFVSISYCVVAIRFGNILPCVAAHFLTNVTGNGSINSQWAYLGLLACLLICAVWSLVLIINIENKNKETET